MSCSNEQLRKRYAEDPEFRERRLASGRAYKKAHREEINEQDRVKRASDPEHREKVRARSPAKWRKFAYGLSTEDYDRMLSRQNGACGICKLTFQETPCVDHCHATRLVRGLLCRRCNTGLGCFNDDPSLLRAAAVYLEAARSLPKPRCLVPAGSPRQSAAEIDANPCPRPSESRVRGGRRHDRTPGKSDRRAASRRSSTLSRCPLPWAWTAPLL
jgi:Recombination endonuclease VII